MTPDDVNALVERLRSHIANVRDVTEAANDGLVLAGDSMAALAALASSLAQMTAERDEARRTVASVAMMLGWGNVPPRDTLERDINAFKGRLSDTEAALASARAQLAAAVERVTKLRRHACGSCGFTDEEWAEVETWNKAIDAAIAAARPPQETPE